MEFTPEVYQHSAGLIIYYDNMNYVNLRKHYSETLGQSALSIVHLENGVRAEVPKTRIPVTEEPVYLRICIEERRFWFEWCYDGSIIKESAIRSTPQNYPMNIVSSASLQVRW